MDDDQDRLGVDLDPDLLDALHEDAYEDEDDSFVDDAAGEDEETEDDTYI